MAMKKTFWLEPRAVLLLFSGLLILLVLTGCSSGTMTAESSITASEAAPGPTATVADTATIPPTSTAAQPVAILLTPPGSDAEFAAEVQSTLAELASEDGYALQTVNELSSSDISEDVRIVVVLAPDPGVRALASATPDTQFLSVGIPGVEAADNLSVLGSEGDRPDQQGFLAGYLAATITPEWRVGLISTQDTTGGLAAGRAFQNGVVFFCGLCRQSRPPYYEYPQIQYLPSGTAGADFQGAVNQIAGTAVGTVYLAPGLTDPALIEGLAAAGVNIIGSAKPPQNVAANWVATIGTDLISPLREIWPQLVEGQGGITSTPQLQITDRNPDLFSPGRQRLVDEMLLELQDGYIGTGVDPATGEFLQYP